MRSLEMKKTTAVDSREWLTTLEPSPEITKLIGILDVVIQDFEHAIAGGLAINEIHYYKLKLAKIDCAELLEQHLEDYVAELTGFTILDTPSTIVQLVYILLNDALEQFTHSLTHRRLARNFVPVDETILAALSNFGL